MKIKTGFLTLFLFIGLLGGPNCIFAQQFDDSVSFTVINCNLDLTNGLTPVLKGGSGGGGGKSSGSSSSSASKAVKKADGSDDETGDGTGWGWMTILIIIIVVLGIIGVLVWYFVLRNR